MLQKNKGLVNKGLRVVRHLRSVAYSVELVVLNKHQI